MNLVHTANTGVRGSIQMTRKKLAMVIVAVAAVGSGCATPHYRARIEMFGERYQDAAAINMKVNHVTDDDVSKVRVFFGSLPAGMDRGKEGLTVVNGYDHRVLGKVSTTGVGGGYN